MIWSWILRGIGILILAAVLLLVVVLLLPAGLDIRWQHGGELEVWLKAGPLRRRFFPLPEREASPPKKAEEPSAASHSGANEPAGAAHAPNAAASDQGAAPSSRGEAAGQDARPPQDEMEALYDRLTSDPVRYARLARRWARGPGSLLIRHLKFRHIRIVCTVTEDNAAQTAITYGALMAGCNTAWAILQDFADLKADELRIEADFTGERRSERCFACQITARMVIIMASILLTVWAGVRRPRHGRRRAAHPAQSNT